MPPSFAEQVLELTRSREPTLGVGRLICVDGPAGSGKTTLARALGRADRTADRARVVHMDALYEGWDGLSSVGPHVLGLLRPLAEGRTGSYRRYDWLRGQRAETREVAPRALLVLEGVGSFSARWADLVTTLVWVEADHDVRLSRGMARDGEHQREHWLGWMTTERAVHDAEGTRARADLVLRTDGTDGTDSTDRTDGAQEPSRR